MQAVFQYHGIIYGRRCQVKKVKIVIAAALLLSVVGGTVVFASTPMSESEKVLEAYPCQACTNPYYGWFCISADWMKVNPNSKIGDVNYYKPGCVWSHYQHCPIDGPCQCAAPGTADWCSN